MDSRYAEVLAKLADVRPCGWGWMARCPAHDDGRRSLAVRIGKDSGDLLLKCHAGCDFESVLSAAGIERTECYIKRSGTVSKEVTSYDYRDENGNLLFQVVRFEPKEFRQRRKMGSGWEWGLGDTRRVLYRLPQLVKETKRTVIFAEGEKDVDRLVKEGFLATCNPMGAGKWDESYTASLTGRTVCIIPDADKPGMEHAANVKRAIQDKATTAIIHIGAKDASEWFNAGHTAAELKEICKAALKISEAVRLVRDLGTSGKLTVIRQALEDLDAAAFATVNVKPENATG